MGEKQISSELRKRLGVDEDTDLLVGPDPLNPSEMLIATAEQFEERRHREVYQERSVLKLYAQANHAIQQHEKGKRKTRSLKGSKGRTVQAEEDRAPLDDAYQSLPDDIRQNYLDRKHGSLSDVARRLARKTGRSRNACESYLRRHHPRDS